MRLICGRISEFLELNATVIVAALALVSLAAIPFLPPMSAVTAYLLALASLATVNGLCRFVTRDCQRAAESSPASASPSEHAPE